MFLITIILLIILFFLGKLFINRRYKYWANLNVYFVEPTFPLGTVSGLRNEKHLALKTIERYNELKGKGPFGGLFLFITPLAFVTDIEMVKNILIKDFPYFMNRGIYSNEIDDPLSAHLFSLEDQKWRDLRNKLTPTFTSGKMKFMFSTIIKVANELNACISNEIKIEPNIEVKEIVSRFTTDVIGTCAFGIDCNSLKNPNAKFREMGKLIFSEPRTNRLQVIFTLNYPEFAKKLRMKSTRDDVSDFFLGVVYETIEYREKNNIKRNDFMDLLLQLKNDSNSSLKLTFEEIAAQAFVFFIAGFETSSTVMAFSLHELAFNHEIQDKARDEVNRILKKYDNEFTYEGVMEMKYIEQILNESLRKYPPLSNMFRRVTKDYKEPITGVTLEKGMHIMIPVYAIHHDPEFYPNPEIFDPERFTDEEIRKRNPLTFLPFGEGPRICIGLRFGMLQAKIGLAILLSKYKFSICDKTVTPIKFRTKSFTLDAEDGIWLNVEKI